MAHTQHTSHWDLWKDLRVWDVVGECGGIGCVGRALFYSNRKYYKRETAMPSPATQLQLYTTVAGAAATITNRTYTFYIVNTDDDLFIFFFLGKCWRKRNRWTLEKCLGLFLLFYINIYYFLFSSTLISLPCWETIRCRSETGAHAEPIGKYFNGNKFPVKAEEWKMSHKQFEYDSIF